MYKLTVVAGPNRGTSYPLTSQEVTIGRLSGNVIVLSSAKVSKKHCTLEVHDSEIVVRDMGSSNGTFVNGTLAKIKKLKPGDRISVGEYVLELVKPADRALRPAPVVHGMGNVIQFPGVSGQISGAPVPSASPAIDLSPQTPSDIRAKALWMFEQRVMPLFYGSLLKTEWRVLSMSLLAVFILATVVVSIYPVLEQNRSSIMSEARRRARVMALQIVDRNSGFLSQKAETKTEIGFVEREPGVRVAMLIDLDNRIIAPGSRMNQYLTNGAEAAFATRMRDRFRSGVETGRTDELEDDLVVAVEPVKVLVPSLGKNVIVAMAIVSLEGSLLTPDIGEMGVAYSQALAIAGILGFLLFLVLYRITLKPLQILNDDIDKVLKGDMNQVTREFRFAELDPLFDIINSTLQRVPKGGSVGGDPLSGVGDGGGFTVEDFVGALKPIANLSPYGMMILDSDRKIQHMNPVFEEITGIRLDNAVGQDVGAVARDQALGPFANDLMDRAGMGASEDFEFSGIPFKVHAAVCGSGNVKCYVLCAVKGE